MRSRARAEREERADPDKHPEFVHKFFVTPILAIIVNNSKVVLL